MENGDKKFNTLATLAMVLRRTCYAVEQRPEEWTPFNVRNWPLKCMLLTNA